MHDWYAVLESLRLEAISFTSRRLEDSRPYGVSLALALRVMTLALNNVSLTPTVLVCRNTTPARYRLCVTSFDRRHSEIPDINNDLNQSPLVVIKHEFNVLSVGRSWRRVLVRSAIEVSLFCMRLDVGRLR